MAYSGSQLTRLGLYGGPRGLYGSFAGKTAGEVAAVQAQTPLGHWPKGLLRSVRMIGRGI